MRMLLFGDEEKYKVLQTANSLLDIIHEKLDEWRNRPIEEKENILTKEIRKLLDLQVHTNNLLKKYYEFYQKHTYKFGEEITPSNDIESNNYIECKKCGYREKL